MIGDNIFRSLIRGGHFKLSRPNLGTVKRVVLSPFPPNILDNSVCTAVKAHVFTEEVSIGSQT